MTNKTLRVFEPALREIARPNTAPTGRWLVRRSRVSGRKQYSYLPPLAHEDLLRSKQAARVGVAAAADFRSTGLENAFVFIVISGDRCRHFPRAGYMRQTQQPQSSQPLCPKRNLSITTKTIALVAVNTTAIAKNASNPHRNPTLSHKRLGLPHREFAIVKNTRGQHSICAADFDAICQMCQRAHTT